MASFKEIVSVSLELHHRTVPEISNLGARRERSLEVLVKKHFEDRIERGEYTWREPETLALCQVCRGLLEVGCGGSLSYIPEKLEVHGVDLVFKMAQAFKANYPKGNIAVSDVRLLPFKDNSFDIVVSTWLLHHLAGYTRRKCLENVHVALHEMKRVLNDKEVLVVRESLAGNILFSLVLFYATFLCAKLHINIDFLDIHSEVITCILTRNDLKQLCTQTGFEAKERSSKRWRFRKINLGEGVELTLKKNIRAHRRGGRGCKREDKDVLLDTSKPEQNTEQAVTEAVKHLIA